MTSYVKFAAEAGDQFLSALAEGQENLLKSLSACSEWAAKVPPIQAPNFAEAFPTPREVSEASFQFATKLLKQQKELADKLLKQQKDFTEKLLAAVGPVNSAN